MEFIDVVRQRRTVRDFTDSAVDSSTIMSLIEVATQAPSARNLQPWSFWVVDGRRQVDELAVRAKEWLLKHPPIHEVYAPLEELTTLPTYSVFYHASALVIVAATSQAWQAVQDCCLAAELLMLAARDTGLGSCWVGSSRPWFDLPITKSLLDIPVTNKVVAPIVLGYPKEWPISHGRKPPVVHWCTPLFEQTG